MSYFNMGSDVLAAEPTAALGISTKGLVDGLAAKNPDDGLLLYYTLNEAAGDFENSVDPATGPNLARGGATTVAAVVGNGSQHAGAATSAGVTGDYQATLGQIGSRTAYGFIRIATALDTGQFAELFGLRGPADGPVFRLGVVETGGNMRVRLQMSTNGTTWTNSYTHTTNLSAATYYFIAAVWDQALETVTTYVNGTAVSAAAGVTTIVTDVDEVSVGIQGSDTDKTIICDEVGYSGRAMSLAELEAKRRNGNGTGYLQAPDTAQESVRPFGFQSSGVTVANTVTETSLVGTLNSGTATFPANGFKLYSGPRLTLIIALTTIAVPGTVTLRIKVGGTTLVSAVFTPTALLSGVVVAFVDVDIQCLTAGTSGSARASFVGESNGALTYTGSGAVDTTIANAVDVTWQWATADAGNSVTVTSLTGIED